MSKVFWSDLKATPKRNIFRKIVDLMERLKIREKIEKGSFVAIKIHFGEIGNSSFIRPIFVRPVVEVLKEIGAKPFLTDTSTLYLGSRSDPISHIETAIRNGFNYTTVGCPIIIADGLRGSDGVKVRIDGEVLKQVSVARAIFEADAIVALTHFKGHELTGFGGALKNIGMGCTTREGKLIQHSNVFPKIKSTLCTGCRLCYKNCPERAIYFKENKAIIDDSRCIGCGACIGFCAKRAIYVEFNESSEMFQKKMVEHVKGVLSNKKDHTFFVNFLMNINSLCDCYPGCGPPIVKDIGILSSSDPVSIDAASCDLVNKEEPAEGTGIKKGEDKWKSLHPGINWEVQLLHAESMGIGERRYHLIKI